MCFLECLGVGNLDIVLDGIIYLCFYIKNKLFISFMRYNSVIFPLESSQIINVFNYDSFR